ncbi:hypothetical protein [Pseudomonas fluorescens]|uniref:Uncharacterized protein n=1 Tax=Pseudomonas fluorescens TaxID=294 RepID=A0A2T0HMZ8_PSEFL|nr:hypothetical protein [Pseudomonas fluorescens]PRW84451.1 hypothetical protein C7A10_28870 [Pseudomonas fluorescens]
MVIELPDIATQQALVFEEGTNAAIEQLKANLKAPRLPSQKIVDENQYQRAHLLRKNEGWVAPDPEIVRAYFEHFQEHFEEFDTDKKLAQLLELSGNRRIRAFKNGEFTVPYEVWRNFLMMTGRVPQDVVKVFAFMG